MEPMNMGVAKALLSGGLLVLVFLTPAVAKTKTGTNKSPTQIATASRTDVVVLDAVGLCGLVAGNGLNVVGELENGGRNPEIVQDTGNVPFYKEFSGFQEYDGVCTAEIWGFMEDYPTKSIGYCAVTVRDPEVRFSVNVVNGAAHLAGGIRHNGRAVYGSWQENVPNPTHFIQAFHNSDTFSNQITKVIDLK